MTPSDCSVDASWVQFFPTRDHSNDEQSECDFAVTLCDFLEQVIHCNNFDDDGNDDKEVHKNILFVTMIPQAQWWWWSMYYSSIDFNTAVVQTRCCRSWWCHDALCLLKKIRQVECRLVLSEWCLLPLRNGAAVWFLRCRGDAFYILMLIMLMLHHHADHHHAGGSGHHSARSTIPRKALCCRRERAIRVSESICMSWSALRRMRCIWSQTHSQLRTASATTTETETETSAAIWSRSIAWATAEQSKRS